MNNLPSTRQAPLMMQSLVVVLGALCFSACTALSEPGPKEIVTAFYKLGLQDLKPKEAFEQYMSPDFVEHAASVAGERTQATIDFLSTLMQQSPPPRWEIVRRSLKVRWCFCMCASHFARPLLWCSERSSVCRPARLSSIGTFSSQGRNIRSIRTRCSDATSGNGANAARLIVPDHSRAPMVQDERWLAWMARGRMTTDRDLED